MCKTVQVIIKSLIGLGLGLIWRLSVTHETSSIVLMYSSSPKFLNKPIAREANRNDPVINWGIVSAAVPAI